MPMRTDQLKLRGYTLTELIVVFGILAVLASMLFPAAARARSQARSMQCTSQLKQLGQALMMYDMDRDRDRENYPDRLTHLHRLKYVSDPRVFVCPMDYTRKTNFRDKNTGRYALKPYYEAGVPKDDKADWAERKALDANEENCSYLYELSTRVCDSWWSNFLIEWEFEMSPELEQVDFNGDGIAQWQEAKLWQLENGDMYVSGWGSPGDDDIPPLWSDEPNTTASSTTEPMRTYPRTWFPAIRCFWHCTPALVDDADNQNRGPEEVLNLAIGGNTFWSVPGWEQTAWKYAHQVIP